jgi:superfamily II DNA or RNA helicase
MQLVLTEPTKLRLIDPTESDLETLKLSLVYTDQKVMYELRKLKHARWFLEKHGAEAWKEAIAAKTLETKKCLLFEDRQGYWVPSGLAQKVSGLTNQPVQNRILYPDQGSLGWENKPDKTPYPFQIEAFERLIEAKHASVEIGTGLGKSLIVELLIKELGLKTVIMCPFADIAKKFYEECVEAFGPKKVGFYGDGKKKVKQITIAIGQSLTRIKEESKEWDLFADTKLFIADESHLTPAKTLDKVCYGLMAGAPYRFFFSGTQQRGDGLDLALDGIIGPVVYSKTVKEGIDEGYLCPLGFTVFEVESDRICYEDDPNAHTRVHLFYNEKVNKLAANLANQFVAQGRQVLILLDELEQFAHLYPLLSHSVKFAHGGVTAENADKLPKPFHKSDPTEFVKEFNRGEFPILCGTSCITTGTDILPNTATINLCGGKSEIQLRQGAIGRSTRKKMLDGSIKEFCDIVDVDVTNNEVTHRHALERKKIYNEVYGPVRTVKNGA